MTAVVKHVTQIQSDWRVDSCENGLGVKKNAPTNVLLLAFDVVLIDIRWVSLFVSKDHNRIEP